MTILQDIPWTFDLRAFYDETGIGEDDELAEEGRRFAEAAAPLLKPKAVYTEAFVEALEDTSVIVSGVRFTSAVLRKNMEGIQRVFPFVATCGIELEQFDLSPFDYLAFYWVDKLKELALAQGSAWLHRRLVEETGFQKLSSMNPGSGNVDVWPLRQQRELFSLLPGGAEAIGVTLTDTCLMTPNKTVSGIFFPSEVNYMNCKVCTRKECPNRRAAYNEVMATAGH